MGGAECGAHTHGHTHDFPQPAEAEVLSQPVSQSVSFVAVPPRSLHSNGKCLAGRTSVRWFQIDVWTLRPRLFRGQVSRNVCNGIPKLFRNVLIRHALEFHTSWPFLIRNEF